MPLLTASHYLDVGSAIQHLIRSKISPSPRLPRLIHFAPQGGGGCVWRQIKGLEDRPERDRGTAPTTADIC